MYQQKGNERASRIHIREMIQKLFKKIYMKRMGLPSGSVVKDLAARQVMQI